MQSVPVPEQLAFNLLRQHAVLLRYMPKDATNTYTSLQFVIEASAAPKQVALLGGNGTVHTQNAQLGPITRHDKDANRVLKVSEDCANFPASYAHKLPGILQIYLTFSLLCQRPSGSEQALPVR